MEVLSNSFYLPEDYNKKNQHQMSARATSSKLIKIQTVSMKCAVNLGVSFAQDNTESRSFTARKQTVKLNGRRKMMGV